MVVRGDTVFAGCQDGYVKVLDLETKTVVRSLIVAEVSFAPVPSCVLELTTAIECRYTLFVHASFGFVCMFREWRSSGMCYYSFSGR